MRCGTTKNGPTRADLTRMMAPLLITGSQRQRAAKFLATYLPDRSWNTSDFLSSAQTLSCALRKRNSGRQIVRKGSAVDIAGFVPLGLIACAYFSWTRSCWKAILIATSACGALSFVIEVLQYYIPPRFSGTTDILTNTLGAAVGAALIRSGAVRQALKETKLIRS